MQVCFMESDPLSSVNSISTPPAWGHDAVIQHWTLQEREGYKQAPVKGGFQVVHTWMPE